MIDLHCHLLDETDCGPRSFAESLEMCRRAAEDGVRVVVATLRWDAQRDAPPLSFKDCERKLEQLRLELNGVLALKLGFDLRLRSDLAAVVARYGSRLTLGGGRYVLVSLPSLRTPVETEDVWSAIRQQGREVVVARPECSPALRRAPERLQRWVAGGIRLQLDAASIVGAYGREVQSFALHCAREYHRQAVVASNARGVDARRVSLALVREVLTKKAGPRTAQLLLNENPAAIIKPVAAGLQPDEQSAPSNNSILSRLRSLRPQKTLWNES